MLEKRFAVVAPQAFTVNGSADGTVTVADTSLFKVKQRVNVAATGQVNQELEVKLVVSSTAMKLGPITGPINSFTDLSAYTTAAGANVFANEQKRPQISADDFERAVYEEEPTVAKRTVLVDRFGHIIDASNPLPSTIDSGTVTVDNFPAVQPVSDNGSSLTVDGTVAVSNFPASQAVTVSTMPNTTPYGGGLKVSGAGEPGTLFYDPLEGVSLDTVFRWNTPTGAGAPTLSNSMMAFNTGTTGSAYGKIFTRPTFNAIIPGFFQHSWAVAIDTGTSVLDAHRFWGMGTSPSTPTVAAPLTDAIGFEVMPDGILYATVYRAGVNIHRESLAAWQPTDGIYRRYICQVRTDRIFWGVEGLDATNVRSTAIFKVPTTQIMPLLIQCVNGITQTIAPNLRCQGIVGADTAKNASQISDGEFQWQKAAVSRSRGLQVEDSMVYLTSAQGGYQGFNVTTDELSIPGAGAPVALFENPAGSGRNCRIWRTNLSTDTRGRWRRYRNVSITTRGTAATAVNRGGGANSPVARLYQNGQFTLTPSTAPYGGTLGKSEAAGNDQTIVSDEQGTIVVQPGQSIMFTYTPRTGSSLVSTEIVWWEEST